MANLEQIMAETSKSYDNSRNALNNQIDAIAGDLAAQKQRLNAQYAQQYKNLDNQRNFQAQASSMAASANGGSFGGTSEIANKKFYQQAFVPAVTQANTNQANDLSSAESQANANRLSLQNTLAQLNDEANRYGIQRYDTAVQREAEEAFRQKQLEEQIRQFNEQLAEQKRQADLAAETQRRQIAASQAAQNAYTNYLTQAQNASSAPSYKYDIDRGMSTDGQIWYKNSNTGNSVRFGTFAQERGGNYKALLSDVAANDNDARKVLNYLNTYAPNAKITYMGGNGVKYYNDDGDIRSALNRLGIKISGLSKK